MRAILVDWLVEVHFKFKARRGSVCACCGARAAGADMAHVPAAAARDAVPDLQHHRPLPGEEGRPQETPPAGAPALGVRRRSPPLLDPGKRRMRPPTHRRWQSELRLCAQVGITAMLIASKYEDVWAPEVRDFVYISDHAYTSEQILEMEKIMLNTLRFQLTVGRCEQPSSSAPPLASRGNATVPASARSGLQGCTAGATLCTLPRPVKTPEHTGAVLYLP